MSTRYVTIDRSMRAHVFQHVPFEDIGSIRSWLDARGAVVTYTRFFVGDPIPALDALDLLIVMGGPMSVNDEALLPWLVAEKEALRDAMARHLPTLGICLGAQLIASALGASVYPNPAKEIGWFPIRAVDAAAGTFRFPADCTVFHWHGETFDLPAGARRLAESAACANQAFEIHPGVIGLQFHLETMPESAGAIVRHCSDDLVSGRWVQDAAAILGAPAARYEMINHLMRDVLDHLVSE
jgi:GMP synthase-like glutamine amidotransferase